MSSFNFNKTYIVNQSNKCVEDHLEIAYANLVEACKIAAIAKLKSYSKLGIIIEQLEAIFEEQAK